MNENGYIRWLIKIERNQPTRRLTDEYYLFKMCDDGLRKSDLNLCFTLLQRLILYTHPLLKSLYSRPNRREKMQWMINSPSKREK